MNQTKSRYNEYNTSRFPVQKSTTHSRNYSHNPTKRHTSSSRSKIYHQENPKSQIRGVSHENSKNGGYRSFRQISRKTGNFENQEEYENFKNQNFREVSRNGKFENGEFEKFRKGHFREGSRNGNFEDGYESFSKRNHYGGKERFVRNEHDFGDEYDLEGSGEKGYERSYRDIKEKDMKKENKRLRSEIRKIRKEQVGWFGKQNNVKVENVTIENDYFIKENSDLKNELRLMKEEIVVMGNDNQELVNRIHILENDNAKLETLLGNQKSQTNSVNHTKIETITSKFILEKEKIMLKSTKKYEKMENYYKQEIDDLKRKLEQSRRSKKEITNLQNKSNFDFENQYSKHQNLEIKNQMNDYSQYNFLKSNRNLHEQKHVLNSQLDQRNIDIKKLEMTISELRSKIEILQKNEEDHKCDYYHKSNDDRIDEFKSSMDLYLKKLKEKSAEIEILREKNKNLESNIHSLKLEITEIEMNSKILEHNNNDNFEKKTFEVENQNLKIRNNSLENEIEQLRIIIEKEKNNTHTNTRVEIVKEVHNNNFGLENFEIEEMALKNVVLELELKRLKNLLVNKEVNLKNNYEKNIKVNYERDIQNENYENKLQNQINERFQKNENYERNLKTENYRNSQNPTYQRNSQNKTSYQVINSQNPTYQRNSQNKTSYQVINSQNPTYQRNSQNQNIQKHVENQNYEKISKNYNDTTIITNTYKSTNLNGQKIPKFSNTRKIYAKTPYNSSPLNLQENLTEKKNYINHYHNHNNLEREEHVVKRVVGVTEFLSNKEGLMEEVDYVPSRENNLNQFSLKY